MRSGTDKQKLLTFIEAIGQTSRGPGRVYLTGDSTALLLGIRDTTIDIDIKLDPEPLGVFESIANLKESLGVNVELAAPDQFIPPIPGWRERSESIALSGQVEFFHYDFYGQALAKILRGHGNDLFDVKALIELGKVELRRLKAFFEEIRRDLVRYPAVDAGDFEDRLNVLLAGAELESD